jgi:sigma-B regulation protein RsbU (phosphoserine phosphatase)
MMKLSELSKWHQRFDSLEAMTRHLQKILIDFHPIQTDHFEIIGFNQSSEMIGGDYIGLIPKHDGSLIISIGDVMGKGLTAGFLTGMIHGALSGITLQEHEPDIILSSLNKALIYDFQRFNAFATFLVSLYDEKSRTLSWANAGQNYPLLWKSETKQCQPLELKGIMVGVLDPLTYKVDQIRLEKGDIVFWYTDGLIELRNSHREQYGINRVRSIIEKFSEDGLQNLVMHLQADLFKYCEDSKFSDDISFIALKVL